MNTVLVYGELWTDCCAMEGIARRYSLEPVSRHDSSLRLGLSQSPGARLILCLRPHEHVYLFCHLRRWLKNRNVLVVTDRVYYSERCVMRYFRVSGWRGMRCSLLFPGDSPEIRCLKPGCSSGVPGKCAG